MANSAKEAFKAGGKTEPVSSLPQTPMVQIREKVGGFMTGKYVARKDGIKLSKGLGTILQFKLDETDLKVKIKSGEDYVETTVTKGDTVAVLAPTRLARTFENIEIGTEVYIEYCGQDTSADGEPHIFEVLKKSGKPAAAKAPATSTEEEF